MKTSRIKEVVSSKPHSNGNIYHNLILENGDKINIGKKKEQKVGWEISYEIVDEQSGEFKRSKSVQSQNTPPSNNSFSGSQNENKGLNVQNLIVAQSCISSACTLLQQSMDANPENVLKAAQMFFDWAMKKGK